MSKRRPSEIAAAGFASPTAVIVAGVPGPARVEQWSGEEESPDSLTVFYEAGGIQVTTYSKRWSEDASAMLLEDGEEVADWWVENAYGWSWWAGQPEALDFSGLEIAETTFVKTEKGYLRTSMYEPLPEDEEKRRRLARREVAKNARHRVVPLPLGDSLVDATVVGDAEMWAAGFEMPADSISLSVLLSGGSVAVDTLRLELVDDLLAYLDQTRAEAF